MLADLVKQILLCQWRPERGAVIREKLCPKCDRYKPIEAFGTKGTRRQSWCFVCVRENNRKAYRRKA